MVNDTYKCIFIEVPKTGSTSIRSILGQPEKPHKNIIEIKQGFSQNKKLFDTYFKFGFVRNPWDRVVSLYERKEGIQMSSSISFADFVDWIQWSSDTCIHPSRHRFQIDWFLDEKGEIGVDYIGKFESLREDWSKIQKNLNIKDSLPHLNKNSTRRHYTDYYTEKTKDIIYNKFAKDIEFFNYRYGE